MIMRSLTRLPFWTSLLVNSAPLPLQQRRMISARTVPISIAHRSFCSRQPGDQRQGLRCDWQQATSLVRTARLTSSRMAKGERLCACG